MDVPVAQADFTFGEPVNIQADFPFLDPAAEGITCLSADGLEVYLFLSPDRPGGYGLTDICVAKRSSVQDEWAAPENLGPLVNGETNDTGMPFLSADGLELYFQSDRPVGSGGIDLYVTRRATRTSPWEAATNLGPKVNSEYNDDRCGVAGWLGTLYLVRPAGWIGRFRFLRQQACDQERPLGRRGQCRPGGE